MKVSISVLACLILVVSLQMAAAGPGGLPRAAQGDGASSQTSEHAGHWDAKSAVATIKDALTIVAIVIAGVLFFRRRRHLPRALVEHGLTWHALTSDKALLSIEVRIHNPGEGLLVVRAGELKVVRVLPLGKAARAMIDTGEPRRRSSSGEINWPLIEHWPVAFDRGNCEIEPGERETLVFEFVLDRRVKLLRVSSFLENQTKRGRRVGWATSTIHAVGHDSATPSNH